MSVEDEQMRGSIESGDSGERRAGPDVERELWTTWVAWLLIPVVLGVLVGVAPWVRLPMTWLDFTTFVGGILVVVGGFALLAVGGQRPRGSLLGGIAAAVGLLLIGGYRLQGRIAVVVVDTSLLWGAFALGTLIGSKVDKAGHLLPASFVVSAVDIISVVHPRGPSHAVAQSKRWLDVLTVSFPIFGTPISAPTVGVGDLLIVALMVGAAKKFSVSLRRVLGASFVGFALAGVVSAVTQAPIPALPLVSGCIIATIPAFRRLEGQDRTVGWIAVVVASIAAAVVVYWRFVLAGGGTS